MEQKLNRVTTDEAYNVKPNLNKTSVSYRAYLSSLFAINSILYIFYNENHNIISDAGYKKLNR